MNALIPEPSSTAAAPDRAASTEVLASSPYDAFAAVYDRHFGGYARSLLGVLDRLALAELAPGSPVLDVCCGTGQLAHVLSARGFAVTGIDRSAGMLSRARVNAPRAQFVPQDVRDFQLATRFHAAFSTFDSINHLLEPADLVRTFRCVAAALIPGARFVFDVNLDHGYRFRWGGCWKNATCSVRAEYSPATGLARNHVTWLDGRPDPPVVMVERCYAEDTLRGALAEAGFSQVEVYDGHGDLGLLGEIGRAFFVARRGETDLPSNPDSKPVPAITEPPGPHPHRPPNSARTLATFRTDGVWPPGAVVREAGAGCRRLRALELVLGALPTVAYEKLKRAAPGFAWFLPHEWVMGQLHSLASRPASAPSRLVYLAPALEQLPPALVREVVAHELAHVILGHTVTRLDSATYRHQEAEAERAVRDWGFQSASSPLRPTPYEHPTRTTSASPMGPL